ncbi:MAG: hypothetical protein Q9M15_02225 [Mariprofundaceae bacterium]|nr:hypothetical protein [Mariprofundaceae bacterium]
MELKNIVPWGRSFNEYKSMFSLTNTDLNKKILGCADGPASFNAELTERGGSVVSVDPVYQFDSLQIRSRIDDVYPHIMSEVKKNTDDYIWKDIPNIEALGKTRMNSMEAFLDDYEAGKKDRRYIKASLPILPFEDQALDLALCSHYLFLYSEHIDEALHIASMLELCRVAQEVRVYPLVSLDGSISKYLDVVISSLKNKGMDVSLQDVAYQFQNSASQMLVVKCV